MQIQTWHPPLRLCVPAKYYVKSGLTNVLKNANQTKKYVSFFDWDCQLSCSRIQHSDAGEVRSRGSSVSSQALYHWAA